MGVGVAEVNTDPGRTGLADTQTRVVPTAEWAHVRPQDGSTAKRGVNCPHTVVARHQPPAIGDCGRRN